jgi:hypothetical protein
MRHIRLRPRFDLLVGREAEVRELLVAEVRGGEAMRIARPNSVGWTRKRSYSTHARSTSLERQG